MSIWTVKGATGAALDATEVDIEAMAMEEATLDFQAQGEDKFTFFLPAPDAVSDPDYLPDYLQTISVWRSGVRQFQGKVLEPEFVWDSGRIGWNIRAEGGWPELEKVPLVSANSYYTRAQGNLTTSIQAVIDVAIAGGAQIVRGTIASTFSIPPVSFRSMSCAAALLELLRWIPDASLIFDYTPSGLPVLNMVRRSSMTLKTWNLGTDEIALCRLSPIAGQTPDKVVLTYPIADANGVVTEVTQTAGTGTAAAQAVVFSDPSLTAFQTSAAAAQIAMRTVTTASWDFAWNLYKRDPKLAGIDGIPTPSTGSVTYIKGPTSGDKSNFTLAGSNAQFTGITSPNNYVLAKGRIENYMLAKLGFTQGVCTFSSDFSWIWRDKVLGVEQDKPDWLQALIAAGAQIVATGWYNSTETSGSYYGPDPDYDTTEIWRYRSTFECITINKNYNSADVNVRDPGDYSQVAPPSDLATNLLAVQNFLPFKGRIESTPYDSWGRLLAYTHEIGDGNPRLEGIAAVPTAERIELQTGIRELSFGAPNRKAMTSLMTRFRSI